jgi:hypothetical protein
MSRIYGFYLLFQGFIVLAGNYIVNLCVGILGIFGFILMNVYAFSPYYHDQCGELS